MTTTTLKEWSSLLEWLKRPFFAFAATIILWTFLLTDNALGWLGLGGFRPIIAILFALSLCVLLSQCLAAGWAGVSRWRQLSLTAKNYRKRLHQLTPGEKFVLKRYVDGQTRTQYLDINDGIAAGLESARIINRMSVTSIGGFKFPYNITDFAWNYLNTHPSVLAES